MTVVGLNLDQHVLKLSLLKDTSLLVSLHDACSTKLCGLDIAAVNFFFVEENTFFNTNVNVYRLQIGSITKLIIMKQICWVM